MKLYKTLYASPVGVLPLYATENALVALLWENDKPDRVKLPYEIANQPNAILNLTTAQLTEYFAGTRKQFDIPLEMIGTPFQLRVWQQLQAIPYGQTRTYGQLAKNLNQPNASRAVGAANGRNPISIIVPCHRVIGMSGKLTGFAGGIVAKQLLLNLEGNGLF